MNEPTNYQRIEAAIQYIVTHFKQQPSLEEVAEAVHLSPFHFQRMFQEWAGVSPKKFMQYLSVEHAKQLLEAQHSLMETALETGLSSSSRLHDLFINIEGMTPGEYKQGGASLTIHYHFYNTPFGEALIASTNKGICHIAFESDPDLALNNLIGRFPNAAYLEADNEQHQRVLQVFQPNSSAPDNIKLHLAGTPFQLKVWQSLLRIPSGTLSTYGSIAKQLGQPNAARAVGTAVGSNPIAYLIPCHRVIRNSGQMGEYRWGSARKAAIIGWESGLSEFEASK